VKYLIPFEGKPVWIACENLLLLLMPVLGKPTKADLQSMALTVDKDDQGDFEYFIKKMTKQDLLLKTKHKFDCKHDWILARMFLKRENEEQLSIVIPEDDDSRLKINLTLLPEGTIGNTPIQWLHQGEKN
jgi:hypothetical protein